MVEEATLVPTKTGLVPQGQGWYVVNARESRWLENGEFGSYCHFEGDVRFSGLGVNLAVLAPGQPACMYHGESEQEGFLVLAGECLLLVEGEERPLRAWDFFHCPPWTEHVLVGAGSGPCLILAVGGRAPDDAVRYPVAEVALRHGAGVREEADTGREAYAGVSEPVERPYREGDLPSWY
jgi:uncharacterized cupin superfamily protein